MDTLRILVVDDEQGMRMAVARALRDFKVRLPDVDGEVCFMVEQAATGEDALVKIDAVQPHILLLDYKLPGISGRAEAAGLIGFFFVQRRQTYHERYHYLQGGRLCRKDPRLGSRRMQKVRRQV